MFKIEFYNTFMSHNDQVEHFDVTVLSLKYSEMKKTRIAALN